MMRDKRTGHDHATDLSRRDLLRRAAGAAGLLLPHALLHRPAAGQTAAPSGTVGSAALTHDDARLPSDLDVALRADAWIRTARVKTPAGTIWPADPRTADSVVRSLYTGTPGVVLFLLELHDATGEAAALADARAGADDIVANLPVGDGRAAGLYTGAAGQAFVLAQTWRATGDVRYRDAARRVVAGLRESARPAGSGVEWNESADIISGGAGIVLFLVYAAKTVGEDGALELALRGARRLIELGRPEEGGLSWGITPDGPTRYPNFSHGTAGVAYALATLYGETREPALLDAALAGERYLNAATDRSAGCRIFHHEPGGRDLFYLSWCHGGAGTARLYYRLGQVTGESAWQDRIDCFARGITAMGAPVERSPGYWNNISQCCGNAGVGEFFLSLHRLWPDRGYLEVARRAATDITARATSGNEGMYWVQAEHRVRPELLVAQTGHMQGAAGVGSFFLRLHAQAEGRTPRIQMPDSPWV